MAVCYSRGVEQSSSCAKGSSTFDEIERGRMKWRSAEGLGRLSFGFGFEQSKAWAGCDVLWAVIFVLVGGFAVKMGYPVLLVPDSSPRAFGGISFIPLEA
jgi:hypothetical protein